MLNVASHVETRHRDVQLCGHRLWFNCSVTFNKPQAVINLKTFVRGGGCRKHLFLDVIHQVLQIQIVPVVDDGFLHKLPQSITSLREDTQGSEVTCNYLLLIIKHVLASGSNE